MTRQLGITRPRAVGWSRLDGRAEHARIAARLWQETDDLGEDGLVGSHLVDDVTDHVDIDRSDTECDGVASFDGAAWTHYLRDHCIYAMDIAPDGTVWVQAGERPTHQDFGAVATYVIRPEAVAAEK